MNDHQAFGRMGVQTFCGWPLSKENCFIFHLLPYKLLIILSRPYSTYWVITFQILSKSLVTAAVQVSAISHKNNVAIRKVLFAFSENNQDGYLDSTDKSVHTVPHACNSSGVEANEDDLDPWEESEVDPSSGGKDSCVC